MPNLNPAMIRRHCISQLQSSRTLHARLYTLCDHYQAAVEQFVSTTGLILDGQIQSYSLLGAAATQMRKGKIASIDALIADIRTMPDDGVLRAAREQIPLIAQEARDVVQMLTSAGQGLIITETHAHRIERGLSDAHASQLSLLNDYTGQHIVSELRTLYLAFQRLGNTAPAVRRHDAPMPPAHR